MEPNTKKLKDVAEGYSLQVNGPESFLATRPSVKKWSEDIGPSEFGELSALQKSKLEQEVNALFASRRKQVKQNESVLTGSRGTIWLEGWEATAERQAVFIGTGKNVLFSFPVLSDGKIQYALPAPNSRHLESVLTKGLLCMSGKVCRFSDPSAMIVTARLQLDNSRGSFVVGRNYQLPKTGWSVGDSDLGRYGFGWIYVDRDLEVGPKFGTAKRKDATVLLRFKKGWNLIIDKVIEVSKPTDESGIPNIESREFVPDGLWRGWRFSVG